MDTFEDEVDHKTKSVRAIRSSLDTCLPEIRSKHHRVDAEVSMRGVLQCRVVYRSACPYHSGLPALEIQHLWVDTSLRRQGIASAVLQEIQSWFVSKGIHVAGIYVSKENSQKHLDMFLLFKSVGKGRMDLSSKKIWGFTIE